MGYTLRDLQGMAAERRYRLVVEDRSMVDATPIYCIYPILGGDSPYYRSSTLAGVYNWLIRN